MLVLFTQSLSVRFSVRIEGSFRPCFQASLSSGVVISQSGRHFRLRRADPDEDPPWWVGRRTSSRCRSYKLPGRVREQLHEESWDCGGGSVYSAMSRSFWTMRRVRKKSPVGGKTAAIFIRLCNVVGTDGDEAAVGNFELAVELNKSFGLPAVFGAGAAPAENENHRMLSLQFGKLPGVSRRDRKARSRGRCCGNDVRSHMDSSRISLKRRGCSDLLPKRQSHKNRGFAEHYSRQPRRACDGIFPESRM